MDSTQKRDFEYPFGKKWVFASFAMSLISIIFGVFMLSEEGLATLLVYFSFMFIATVIVLAFKFYLYFLRRHEPSGTETFEDEGEASKKHLKLSFIVLVCLAIVSLFVPLILLMFLEPLWWVICIASYVPAVNIPEVILYTYCKRTIK